MKNQRKKSLLIGSIISFLIVITPYLVYAHKLIPVDDVNYKFLFFTLKGGHFGVAQMYVYFLLSKLVPLILFIIWFLTTKQWWAFAISIPIIVYLSQLINVINDSNQYVDEVSFIYSVPIAVVVVGALYVIRKNIAVYVAAVDLKEEMDAKIDARIEKNKKYTENEDTL